MWRLVRLELEFSWRLLVPVIALVPAALVAAHHLGLVAHRMEPWGYFVGIMTAQAVFSERQKARRDRQLALLPLPSYQLGLARLASCVLPGAAALVSYGSARVLLEGSPFPSGWVEIGIGLVFLLMGLLLLVQDLFSWSPKREYDPRRLTVHALIVVVLPVLIVSLMLAVERGRAPALAGMAGAVRASLTSPQGPTRFLALTFVFAFLSVLTFGRRKSYLQK